MRSLILLFSFLAGLVAATSAQAQGAISGTVTDELGGEGISSVQVLIDALGLETLADEDGRYRLQNVPEGRHRLTARQIGYASVSVMVTVTSGETVVQDFSLSQQVVALDALVVTGVPGETRVRAIGNSLERLDTEAVTEQVPLLSRRQDLLLLDQVRDHEILHAALPIEDLFLFLPDRLAVRVGGGQEREQVGPGALDLIADAGGVVLELLHARLQFAPLRIGGPQAPMQRTPDALSAPRQAKGAKMSRQRPQGPDGYESGVERHGQDDQQQAQFLSHRYSPPPPALWIRSR